MWTLPCPPPGSIAAARRCHAQSAPGWYSAAPRAYMLAPLIFSQDRPAIARRIDELLRRVIDRGHAFENLLIGGIGRRRRAAPGIDQPLDRRAVEHFERPERAAARAPQIKRRRVDHQEVFQEHPKPSRPSMKLIRPREEARERGDARRVGGLHPKRWALADMPGQALDLILARLDDAAQQVVAVGKSAQLGKAGRLVIARRDREV